MSNKGEVKEASIKEALDTIRDVVEDGSDTDSEEEVLELTQKVNDDGSVESIAAADDAESTNDQEDTADDSSGILENISNAVSENQEDEATEAVANSQEPTATSDAPTEESAQEIAETSDTTDDTPAPVDTATSAETDTDEAGVTTQSLLSEQAKSASSRAIQSLINSTKPKDKNINFRSGETIEDLVMEAMRPELSQWLNENLPGLVKQLVEKEIKKLLPEEVS